MKTLTGNRAHILAGLAAPLVVALPQQTFALEDSIEEIVTTARMVQTADLAIGPGSSFGLEETQVER